ncbi:MAG: PilN domain-containing protein, partial [Bacteroidota bacterium]|nr:PilN domain-containing protein [Bacteroidota bacterium]
IILGVLLANFLVFNHYFKKSERIRTNLALDSENKKNLTMIRDKVNEKEKKVDAIVSFSNSRTSFYLDRLAASIPESILLTEVQYQPLQMPVQVSKPVLLQEHTILVLGSSASSNDFSTWITQLESLDWVEKVETMDYDYRNNNSSEFKVQISVADPKK